MKKCLAISFRSQQCHLMAISKTQKNASDDNKVTSFFYHEDTTQCSCVSQINAFVKFHNLTSINTRLLIPFHKIMMQSFSMDASLTDKHIMQFLKTQALSVFGYSAEDLYLDYEIINSNAKTNTICVVVARKKIIAPYLSLLHEAGLKPEVIDVDIFSVARLTTRARETYGFIIPDEAGFLCIVAACGKLMQWEFKSTGSDITETIISFFTPHVSQDFYCVWLDNEHTTQTIIDMRHSISQTLGVREKSIDHLLTTLNITDEKLYRFPMLVGLALREIHD